MKLIGKCVEVALICSFSLGGIGYYVWALIVQLTNVVFTFYEVDSEVCGRGVKMIVFPRRFYLFGCSE